MRQRNNSVYFLKDASHIIQEDAPSHMILPEIRNLDGACYFPIIDGIYQGLSDVSADTFAEQWLHELTHAVLANSYIVCEQRYLSYLLLSNVIDVLQQMSGTTSKLLLPSFVIMRGAETDIKLAEIADRCSEAFAVAEMVQEIVAGIVQFEIYGWSAEQERRVRSYLTETLFRAFGDAHQWDYYVPELIDVYKRIGPEGVITLGRYALNAPGLTRSDAMKRLSLSIKIARVFQGGNPQIGGGDVVERARIGWEFIEYLNQNLPDFNSGTCPLAGECLPLRLATSMPIGEAELISDEGLRALGITMMNELRCHTTKLWVPRDGLIPPEAIKQTYQTLLEATGENAVDQNIQPSPAIADWPLVHLTKMESTEAARKVLVMPPASANTYQYPSLDLAYDLVRIEAIRQQMWRGEGPYCVCLPHQQASCQFKRFVYLLWEHTERDLEWSSSNWKREHMKPECLSPKLEC
jgi:hypothetical protein